MLYSHKLIFLFLNISSFVKKKRNISQYTLFEPSQPSKLKIYINIFY